jgi:predicted nucleic acid-binding Zn ribbon protein
MPTYVYICDDTGEEFEYIQGINSYPLEFWPKDVEGFDPKKPKKVRRKIGTGIGVMLKGTGFYETDYVKKSGGSDE